MRITKFAIDRPVTTSMLFLALVIFGFITYQRLAVNLLPELEIPVVMINTVNVGATPQEIENDITDKIEKEVSTISGIKELKSYSMPDVSLITVEFNNGIDPDKALSEVKSKMDLVTPELPKDAERPYIQKYKLSDIPVIDLVVSSDRLSGTELYDYVDKTVKGKLSQLEGVSKIDLDGGEIREIKVLADQATVYDMQMSLQNVADYLKTVNAKVSGGNYKNGDRSTAVEVGNVYESIDEIRQTLIPSFSGVTPLSDFAEVKDSIMSMEGTALYFDVQKGKHYPNIVSVGVMKTSNANSVKVARGAKELVEELRKELPEGVDISIPFDTSEYVESAVDDALTNIILGVIITGIVLFFFLNDLRTTVIVSISIPVSLMGTFMAIRVFGGSLNMMTLMSFSVAIGALVSNSIVVIENIIRLRNTGMNIKEASVEGTREVMMAVIASTGTNLVVFLPVAMMSSTTGAFFKEYALTISAATIFSLIVSFMLTPMLASRLLRKERKPGRLARLSQRFFERLENAYEKSLIRLISKKWKPLVLFAVMFIIFVSSMSLLPSIGFEFQPQEDTGEVYVKMEMPPGTAVHKTEELVGLAEKEIGKLEGVKAVLSIVGSKDESTSGSNYANMKIKLVPKEERSWSNTEYAEVLEKRFKELPMIIATVSSVSSDDGAPIQLLLKSESQEDLVEANHMISEELKKMDGLLNFESSMRKGKPLVHFTPKSQLLAELNLSPVNLAVAVRNAINGVKATVFKEKGREYDIRISYPEHQINSVEKIEQIPLVTEQGTFTIGQLASVSYEQSPSQILHDDKVRMVNINGNLATGALQGDVQNDIEEMVSQLNLPESVKFSWAGNVKELEEAMADLLLTFGIAFILMYMLLASLLENFWQPVIIFTTVPMAMIGVFVFMYAFGSTMNIMSLMAIITLLGLVVNDDILIHDYTDQLMYKKGMNIYDATIKAGKTKMKTVIMTTVAIIFGMLPNALGIGDAGASLRTPMAIVTIGGMITSTVLTLYLIPSIFYVIRSKKGKIKPIIQQT